MISPQKQYEVSILFRVHAPKASPLERVWLLGSIPELGEWNPARAVECGQAADEWKVWQATVRLPTDSSFKWAWCTLTVDGHLKSFENGDKRFRQIFCYSGVLHTIYSEPDVEVFRQNMGSAVLTTERKTKRNDVVAVIGSCPSLGCWDPKHAVIANEFPRRSGNWTATVFFDSGRLQEWNWIIMDKNTKEIRLSEKHSTRFLFDTHGWIKIHVEWNKEPAVLDWAPRDHVGDDYIGTVELLRKMKARLLEIRRWEDAAEARRLGFPAGRMLPSPTLMGQINLPQYSNITFLSSPTMSPSKSPQPVLQIKPFRGSGLPDQINTSPIKSPPASPIRSVSPGTGDQAPPDASMPALQPHTSRTRAVSPPPVPKRSAGTCTEVVSESNSESERIKKQKNTPIDMSLLGFHCSPPQQSPPRGKTESGTDEKRRNLVSDPGKPGYSSDLPHGFGTDPDGQARKYNVTSTSPPLFSRYDISPPPFSRYDISPPPFSRYDSSPPLFSRYDSSPPLDVEANDSKIAPTPGIENYLGHSLLGRDAGILISSGKPLLLEGGGTVSGMEEKLGLPPNMEVGMDRLKMLQDISEVREQARTLDRMELVRQREERNKAKFQHGLDFANAATIKRSASPPRNRPSFNSSEKSPTVEGKSADFSFTTQSKQKEDSSNNFGVQNRTVSPTSLTEKSPPKKVSGKVHKTARDQQSDKNTPKPTQTADKGDAMSSPSITSPSKGSKDALTADLKANQRTEDRDPQAQACSSASDVEDAKRRNIGCFGGNAKNILKKNNSTRKSRATERCERCSAPIADGKVRGDACHCSNPSHVRSGARKTSSPSPRFNQSVTNNPGKGK